MSCLRTGIVIVSHDGDPVLAHCLDSLLASGEPAASCVVLVVANGSEAAARVCDAYPAVERLSLDRNLGFAGGCNAGWAHLRERYPDLEYLVLLNQDVVVLPGWRAALERHLDADPGVAIVQPRLLLAERPDLVNSRGLRSHFLGFTYLLGYLESARLPAETVEPLDAAAGAAMMIRTRCLDSLGLFQDSFFLYCEDVDLSWTMRVLGHAIRCVPESVVHHEYRRRDPWQSLVYLEKNRWALLLIHYRWLTLLLIAPALMAVEIGILLQAIGRGAIGEKVRAWRLFWHPSNLRELLRRRSAVQAARCRGDREIFGTSSGRVQDPRIDVGVVRWIGNPLLDLYWRCVRPLIRW